MVHPHGRSHLVRRQRNNRQDEEDEEQEIKTVIMTMPNTFTEDVIWITQSAPKTQIGAPVQQTKSADEPEQTLPAPTSRKPSATAKESEPKEEETARITPTPKPTSSAPRIVTQSSFPSASDSPIIVGSTSLSGLVAATASSSPSASPSAEAAGGGMSGGAKAGVALGILFAIGALLGGILFIYHRKKKQVAQQKLDDEKFAMQNAPPPPPPPPHVEPAPSIRTQRSMSTAPRLSLRPLTQFDPTFPNRKSGGNLLDVAAARAPSARSGDRSPSPDSPSSPWERRGAANAAASPVNPFNDPQARPGSPPHNPFTNGAAIETPQASAPNTPVVANHAAAPSPDLANPAPAIVAADTASVIAALPSPPSIHSTSSSVPPSPAWTDDIPASPGPAPSGPLPVAVAGGPTNGAAPPPNNVHRVQLDFKPSMSDELALHVGQLVRMLHEYDDGWALCVRMDRSQQGVVPRTCLSKHPVKPRTGPPRQGPPGPRMRGPPVNSPMSSGGLPQARPLSPPNGRASPHPPSLSPANGRMSPSPRSMSPGPRQMSPPQGRARSNSNAPYAGPPRSMSPGPYGGGPQMAPPPQMGRPRANSAGQVTAHRPAPPGPSPMNPNANAPMPSRKPLPGQAL